MSKLVNFRAQLVEFQVKKGYFQLGTQCTNYTVYNQERVWRALRLIENLKFTIVYFT